MIEDTCNVSAFFEVQMNQLCQEPILHNVNYFYIFSLDRPVGGFSLLDDFHWKIET